MPWTTGIGHDLQDKPLEEHKLAALAVPDPLGGEFRSRKRTSHASKQTQRGRFPRGFVKLADSRFKRSTQLTELRKLSYGGLSPSITEPYKERDLFVNSRRILTW